MDESDGLENRCTSHSFNEWLDPKKEATSNEVASLVSATPPSGRHPGGDTGGVVGVSAGT